MRRGPRENSAIVEMECEFRFDSRRRFGILTRGTAVLAPAGARSQGPELAMRARRRTSFLSRTVIFSATVLCTCSAMCAKERAEGPGFVKELEASSRDVLDALKSDLEDQTIHGTLIFDKEPTLTGATQSDTARFFAPWTGKGQVFYKLRPQAIAPRHFLESADEGRSEE